jgi:N-acetylglucosaminyl-diphospho-decaprenol L-rhamnosyltransferase
VPTRPSPAISVVVVTWNERDAVSASLPALVEQLRPGDELVVSDNGSTDGTPEVVRGIAPDARIVLRGVNGGFMAGVNDGARAARGDLLVLLNPDARIAPGWREEIERPFVEGWPWSAWQALVTTGDGARINTAGGVVHPSGLAWAGRNGEPAALADGDDRDVGFASGACLAIPRDLWRREGGFPEEFFLYGDDVDLSLRLRLRGERVGIAPRAQVDHAYEFLKNRRKWRFLERARWAVVIRTYPTPVLLAALPLLAASEIGIMAIAARGGWLDQKLLSQADVVRWLPRLVRERRAIQATRRVQSREFARWLTPALDSLYLGDAANSRVLGTALRAYWGTARRLLPPE